jgi:hypothetical protein
MKSFSLAYSKVQQKATSLKILLSSSSALWQVAKIILSNKVASTELLAVAPLAAIAL